MGPINVAVLSGIVSIVGYVVPTKWHANEAHSIHDSDEVGIKVVSWVVLTSWEVGAMICATWTELHKDLDEPTKNSGVEVPEEWTRKVRNSPTPGSETSEKGHDSNVLEGKMEPSREVVRRSVCPEEETECDNHTEVAVKIHYAGHEESKKSAAKAVA